jgi:hypothetical protein
MAEPQRRLYQYSSLAALLLGILLAVMIMRARRDDHGSSVTSQGRTASTARDPGPPAIQPPPSPATQALANGPEKTPDPAQGVRSPNPREGFQKAPTWEGRRDVLLALSAAESNTHRAFLLEVLEGTDVDAVRFTALDKLEECARRQTSSLWLTAKIAERLTLEPRRVIRYGILCALSHLYEDQPGESGFVFDVMSQSVSGDAEGNVRGNAARILGNYFEPARSVPILTSALESEKDAKVRAEIERAIAQARLRKK